MVQTNLTSGTHNVHFEIFPRIFSQNDWVVCEVQKLHMRGGVSEPWQGALKLARKVIPNGTRGGPNILKKKIYKEKIYKEVMQLILSILLHASHFQPSLSRDFTEIMRLFLSILPHSSHFHIHPSSRDTPHTPSTKTNHSHVYSLHFFIIIIASMLTFWLMELGSQFESNL